jgi:hypothetical protein
LRPSRSPNQPGEGAADHHAEHAGCEDRSKRRTRYGPLAPDRGHGNPKQLIIDAVEHNRQRHQEHEPPLHAGPAALIEQEADVEIRHVRRGASGLFPDSGRERPALDLTTIVWRRRRRRIRHRASLEVIMRR